MILGTAAKRSKAKLIGVLHLGEALSTKYIATIKLIGTAIIKAIAVVIKSRLLTEEPRKYYLRDPILMK